MNVEKKDCSLCFWMLMLLHFADCSDTVCQENVHRLLHKLGQSAYARFIALFSWHSIVKCVLHFAYLRGYRRFYDFFPPHDEHQIC